MRVETVTSAQNPKIKDLLALQEKSRLRRERGLFAVEGQRELGHCLSAGFIPQTLFVCGEVIARERRISTEADATGGRVPTGLMTTGKDSGYVSADRAAGVEGKDGLEALVARAEALNPKLLLVQLPASLYEKVALRGSTEGVIGVMRSRELSLTDLTVNPSPLIAVLEGVEKPGNLGAILRSADAAGADAVLICDPLTDLYNPNLIRSSIGAVFTVPTVCCTSQEAVSWLKEHSIRIYTAQLQDSVLYYDCPMTGGTAIAIGTEATGLSEIWRRAADAHIRIPMKGRLDSLNASVSAAILLYEAVRQRNVSDS
ncbi:MAG: TrmH family RNA methyltransferase [Bacteroidia bacterium]|nr:TrmH family RNA methyltransferase [Bacteroidia bacterium]